MITWKGENMINVYGKYAMITWKVMLCDIKMDKYIVLNECKSEMMCINETWIWYGFNAWVYLWNTYDKLYVHEKYMWHMLCAKPTGIDY